MAGDCIFCKIIMGEFNTPFLYEDDEMVAFRDIRPQAPTHVLIIPKHHIPKISDIKPEQDILIGKILRVANQLAGEENISKSGYRLVWNCGSDAGQEVFHIHFHLLGGRKLTWPPG